MSSDWGARMSEDSDRPPGRQAGGIAPSRFPSRPTESAVDYVVRQIKESLIAGDLHPGDRLPPEHELAAQLHVSRGPVREAMKVLQSLGVVTVVRGSGTFIAESPTGSVFDPLLFRFVLSRPGTRHLVELRETLELGICRLVSANAEGAQLGALEQANSVLADAVEGAAHPDVVTDADLAFHRRLAAATGNPLVESVYALILEFFKPLIRQTYNHPGNGRNAVALHARLIEALRSGDAEATEAATLQANREWAERFG